MSQRTGHFDSSVIDQGIQCARTQFATNLVGCKLHSTFIGHIKQQWYEVFPELFLQTVGVFQSAHAAKHAESAIDKHLGRGMPDSSRDSSDNDLFHGSSRIATMVTEAPKQAITNFALH